MIYAKRGCTRIRIEIMSPGLTRIAHQDPWASLEFLNKSFVTSVIALYGHVIKNFLYMPVYVIETRKTMLKGGVRFVNFIYAPGNVLMMFVVESEIRRRV